MTPRPRKEKGPLSLEALPSKPRMAIVKLMAKDNIDVEEAYEKAANLIDINSPQFTKEVEKEALRLHKSRFMKAVNAARVTMNVNQRQKLDKTYQEGHEAGYVQGRNDFQVYYYCDVCRKRIDIFPNSPSHQAVVDYMFEKKWGHNDCHNNKRY
jgi:hypothetical protein